MPLDDLLPQIDDRRYDSLRNQRVLAVPGVQSIQSLIILLDGEEMQECRDVPLQSGALAYSEQHTIEVHYRFNE